jgi:hypothetical protein
MYGLRTDRGRGACEWQETFRDKRDNVPCEESTRYGNEGSSKEYMLTDEASMKGGKERHVDSDSMQSNSEGQSD